jgi:hypothetical protein
LHFHRRVKYLGHLALALLLAAATGCVGELIPIEPGPGPGGGPDAGGGGGGGGGDALARQYFDDNVQPLLVLARPKGACSVCHEGANIADGPDFMGASPATNYDSLVSDTRLVGGDPAASLLVIKGDHSGDAFEPAEVSTINEWILMESEQ